MRRDDEELEKLRKTALRHARGRINRCWCSWRDTCPPEDFAQQAILKFILREDKEAEPILDAENYVRKIRSSSETGPNDSVRLTAIDDADRRRQA